MNPRAIARRALLLVMLAVLMYCADRWPRATTAVVILAWVLIGSAPEPAEVTWS